jgi:hypothetical protein
LERCLAAEGELPEEQLRDGGRGWFVSTASASWFVCPASEVWREGAVSPLLHEKPFWEGGNHQKGGCMGCCSFTEREKERERERMSISISQMSAGHLEAWLSLTARGSGRREVRRV